MSMSRVQFQRGLSMAEFKRRYGTAEQCEEAVRAWRWPQGFICPRCGAGNRTEFRRSALLYLQCAACQYQCSLIAGTVFASTKLTLRTWFLAMHLLTKAKTNVSALELMRDLGLSYRSAWLVKHKLETMRLATQKIETLRTEALGQLKKLGGEKPNVKGSEADPDETSVKKPPKAGDDQGASAPR
jgi:transposase-like protein